MNMCLIFIKKEMVEYYRDKKLFIMFIVFALVGLISPLIAKLTPIILESVSTNGAIIKIPTPTEMDSWAQFFKNIGQMGMLTLILVFSSQMSHELERGTLINLFSKGLSRKAVVMAKFFVGVIIWMTSCIVAFIMTFIYTGYFFDNTIRLDILLFALSLPFLFGVLLLSIELLGGIITGSTIGSLSFVGVSILLQLLLSIKSDWVTYFPIYLVTNPLDLLKGTSIDVFHTSILITIILTVILIPSAVIIMNNKQIV
ncbi:ABC transporter permease [Facklamia miroungae]|uniref:ABC-2 type transport system permease protein n=1 Tax=Facklamia miroungae TaxID=120956 RepID=A0A1G7UAF0_9LACT|nr:ABC transporter permease subunit [Facklamia miroungae]NKZ30031.1 ABC transporter permease subunit [Facklamia miroungae]SDG44556.1 ABC-2 type transport system permease protein [Facklamia miroungae]